MFTDVSFLPSVRGGERVGAGVQAADDEFARWKLLPVMAAPKWQNTL